VPGYTGPLAQTIHPSSSSPSNDVRCHNPGAHHRRDGDRFQVRRVHRLHRALGHPGLRPVAHWVFSPEAGCSAGCEDFAVGRSCTPRRRRRAGVVLVLAVARLAEGTDAPHNVPFILRVPVLLWFGWFGFNAGSPSVPTAWPATPSSTPTRHRHRPARWIAVESSATGTPQRWAPPPARSPAWWPSPGLWVRQPARVDRHGAIAGALCSLAVALKFKFGFDDALDVIGVHLVGRRPRGPAHRLLAPRRSAAPTASSTAVGPHCWANRRSVVVVVLYSFVVSFIIAKLAHLTIGLRVTPEEEREGSTPPSMPSRVTTSAPSVRPQQRRRQSRRAGAAPTSNCPGRRSPSEVVTAVINPSNSTTSRVRCSPSACRAHGQRGGRLWQAAGHSESTAG